MEESDSVRFISSVSINLKINSVNTQIHSFSKKKSLTRPIIETIKNELGTNLSQIRNLTFSIQEYQGGSLIRILAFKAWGVFPPLKLKFIS